MPFIRSGDPDRLPAYLTSPVPSATLDKVRADFALGAHDRWNPLVKLDLKDARTDLYGKSPEEVMQIIEMENDPKPAPFLVIDQDTGSNDSVWLCERWADREDFGDEKNLPYLLRIRTKTVCAALWFVNLDIANISIPELDGAYRGDPSVPYTIEDDGIDHANEKPPVAYVCAMPGEYELSSAPEDTASFLPRPERVIRLTAESAKQLGLVQHWTVGWEVPENGEGAMSFAADRVWTPGQ